MNDLERLDGLHVGQLDDYERWLFRHAVADGLARESYEGAGGFMGLAKVRLVRGIVYPKAA